MKKFKVTLVLALVLVALVLGACAPSEPKPTDNGKPTTTESGSGQETKPTVDPDAEIGTLLKIGLPGDTGGYDPATGTTDTPQQIIKAVYRGLFSVDRDGTLKNEICKEYSVSEDGLVYTFKLREDAKWSDGEPVTAHDFVYGWQRNLIPELKAAYADLFSAVVNFEDCYAGEKELDEFGVKALDDYTFEVTLEHTQPYFVSQTTFSPFFPVRKDKVTPNSSDWSIDVASVVTNGPMMFESYKPNDSLVLVPNPESYEKDDVKLERVEFYFITDAQAAVAAFKNDEIDMAFYVPTDIGDTHANPAEVVNVPYLVNIINSLSARFEPFQDIRVREALSLAIDRQQICDIIGGSATPLYALIPPGITNPATGKDFREEGGNLVKEDVARAKELMAEAGYPNGEGFPTMNYLLNNNQMHIDVAQALQGMWATNLGIQVELNTMEAQAFSADRRAGKFDMGRFGTSADFNDPMTWLALYDSSSAYIKNLTGYETPEFDALIHDSDKELNEAKRFEMLHDAEKLMVDSFWWLCMFTYDKPILVKEYVKDIFTTTAGDIFYHYAYIQK